MAYQGKLASLKKDCLYDIHNFIAETRHTDFYYKHFRQILYFFFLQVFTVAAHRDIKMPCIAVGSPTPETTWKVCMYVVVAVSTIVFRVRGITHSSVSARRW